MQSERDKPYIFISYASEQHDLAADVAAALQAEHRDVFFDTDRLRPSGGYDATIREAIARSQLFIVLMTPDIFKEGSYVRTELKFAREAWQSPVGRVLPVMVARVDRRTLDPFLRRLTPLYPQGDVAAEVAAEVHALLRPSTEERARAGEMSLEVAASRLAAYRALWSLTALLPRWPRADTVSYQDLAAFSGKLRDWYFATAGGLFLTSRAYSRYAELQDALQTATADSSDDIISEKDYDHIRHLCSTLRRQMAVDLGTRI